MFVVKSLTAIAKRIILKNLRIILILGEPNTDSIFLDDFKMMQKNNNVDYNGNDDVYQFEFGT